MERAASISKALNSQRRDHFFPLLNLYSGEDKFPQGAAYDSVDENLFVARRCSLFVPGGLYSIPVQSVHNFSGIGAVGRGGYARGGGRSRERVPGRNQAALLRRGGHLVRYGTSGSRGRGERGGGVLLFCCCCCCCSHIMARQNPGTTVASNRCWWHPRFIC